MKIATLAAALALGMLASDAVYAQTAPATPAPAPSAAPTATPKADAAAKAARSAECSKEADAQGLHGKERKKFRAECKKGM